MGRPRRSSRRLIVALATLAIGASSPADAASHRVDIGGYKLNVRCSGAGSPAVILDAGAGDTLETWDWVVPDVERFTRVCAYDRAGLGRSDPGPLPRSSEVLVEELHTLLVRAHVPGPYVLVGHSFGGFNMRLFASRHPEGIAGLVLVDGTPEDFPDAVAALRTRAEGEKLRTSLGLAPAAMRSELEAMPRSAATVRASAPPDVPVIALTSALGDDNPSARALWVELQRRLAQSFPRGRQVIADRSGHYIQFDQPELVVEAIRELVESARTARRAAAP